MKKLISRIGTFALVVILLASMFPVTSARKEAQGQEERKRRLTTKTTRRKNRSCGGIPKGENTMRKNKFLLTLVICTLALTLLCGCALFERRPATTQENGGSGLSQQQGSQTEEEEDGMSLPGVMQADFAEVQYTVGAPTANIKKVGTASIAARDSYFAIYDQYDGQVSPRVYSIDISEIETPQDVLYVMEEQFVNSCSRGLIRATRYTLSIESEENVKVNDWEMCRTTGKILLAHSTQLHYNEAPFVAYSVIKDGCPVYFAVFDNPNNDDHNVDIGEMADIIAASFEVAERDK